MTNNRIIDITEIAFHLHIENGLLVMENKANPNSKMTIPVSDIAVLIINNRQTTMTQAVISSLAKNKAFLIVSDERSMPISLMLPLSGHTLQTQRFISQVSASKPIQKRLWQQIVRTKIKAQADLLKSLYNNSYGLDFMVDQVKSGDITNLEAQAAQKYWKNLFQSFEFIREPQTGNPPNNLLDYGYAILRAIVARAIVSSGLNVTFGIHHHNRSNSFCLADDLMEPFRVLVDKVVYQIVKEKTENVLLDKAIKQKLISPLLGRFNFDGESLTLFETLTKLTASLVAVYEEKAERLTFPKNIIS